MNKSLKKWLIGLVIWNCVLTVIVLGSWCGMWPEKPKEDSSVKTQYTMYIGLNDKDTYAQKVDTETAKNIINKICVKYTDGYTVSEAKGGWVDEKNILTEENTLCYVLVDVERSKINAIMDEVLKELNQNAILLQVEKKEYLYYIGAK